MHLWFKQADMPGRLTRLLTADGADQLAATIPTHVSPPPRNPLDPGYSPYNKPSAVDHWLRYVTAPPPPPTHARARLFLSPPPTFFHTRLPPPTLASPLPPLPTFFHTRLPPPAHTRLPPSASPAAHASPAGVTRG
jgi:hypothetical protein